MPEFKESGEPIPPNLSTVDWPGPQLPDFPATVTAKPLAPEMASPESNTQQLIPTPGPGEPDRKTLEEKTERLSRDPSTNSGVPEIPGYRIEKLIGRGGMGKVYRAIHLDLNRVEALKLITLGGRDETYLRERFEREVQALARIEHPNVVRVYHAGEWLGFPYLTMKFIPGGTLSQHLHRFTGHPEACARLMVKVCRAVQALHDLGILHRDLKPLNILLGDDDEPLVADFGLARWLDDPSSDVTCTHIPIGTRQYMSPEQTLGQRSVYGVPCDVWSIGVTLYELLAGHRPFQDSRDGTSELFDQIRTADVPPLPEHVPADLAAIARKCMAKRPEDRYPTAEAIALDLERWQAGEKVEAKSSEDAARPGPSRPRLRRWTISLGLLGVIALSVLLLLFLRRDRPLSENRSPTLADRLRAGEEITLVGAKGLPVVPDRVVPGCDGVIHLGQNGYTTLASAVLAAVELSDEELPWPVQLRAEYATLESQNVSSRAGLYVGRRAYPGAIVCQTMVQAGHWTNSRRHDDENLVEMTAFDLAIWDQSPPGIRSTFPVEKSRTTRVPYQANPPLRWQSLELVIDRASIGGKWNDIALSTVYAAEAPGLRPRECIRPKLESWAKGKPNPPAFETPYIGNGIGVFVFNATACYRNVTLKKVER